MGLFFKKTPEYENNKQYDSYAITETVLTMTKSFALSNAQTYLRQALESAKIVDETTNPLTFFYRYDFMIKRDLDLIKMSKYVKFNGDLVAVTKKIINEKQSAINKMIYRSACKLEEKLIKLKTTQSKLQNIECFKESFEPYFDEMSECNITYLNEVVTNLKSAYDVQFTTEKNNQIQYEKEPEKERNEFNEEYLNDSKELLILPNSVKLNVNLEIKDNTDSYWETKFKDINDKVENSYPSKNGLKIPEIMVLDYAETFDNTGETVQSFWYYKYGLKDAKKILDKLMEKELICLSPVEDAIKRFSNAQLKDMLKELNLKVSGKKSELLERIFENTTVDYLESKIKSRGFSITEKGKQELKENAYVMYYHKGNSFTNNPNTDVWWMNRMLYEHPNKTYQEIIWEELQKQYSIARHELCSDKSSRHWQYTNKCNEICRFLLEIEGNAEIALRFFAESSYYNINTCMLKEYHERITYSESTDSPPNLYDCVYLDESSFKKIQKELNISDEDIINKLQNIFSLFNVDKPLLSDLETAKFIVAKIRKDYAALDSINYIM